MTQGSIGGFDALRCPTIVVFPAHPDVHDNGSRKMSDIMVIGARGIPDVEGGAEKNAEMVFPLVAKSGYSVKLVGTKEYITREEYKGVLLERLPTLRVIGTDKIIYHFLAFLCAAMERPKIVHLQGLSAALFLSLYRLLGLKVVVRYGSSDYEYVKWGLIGRIGFRLCEMQIRFADHVIVVSEKYKRDLERRYDLKRVEVVQNGVDDAMVTDEAKAFWDGLGIGGSPYVLAVGRVTADKDYDTLVDAFAGLADRAVKLVVAGGRSEPAYADRFFNHPSDRVHFIGRIDRRLLAALYDKCALFVNCSLHEGMSNALLEAISFGRPIIASDISANKVLELNDVSYFPVGNAAALRARIEAALSDPSAFVTQRTFIDWSEVTRRTIGVYQQVLPSLHKVDLPAEPRTLA